MAGLSRFPRVFWVALGLEFLERLAFYGVYVNLAVYLTDTVGISDVENGMLLGVFAVVRAWVPVVTGAAADRIGFRRSLCIAFALYVLAYLLLFAAPSRVGAWGAVMGMALAGAFLKPVIPATVRKHAPADGQAMGFSLFYASVNAGSVVGKVLTKIVRQAISLRASMINAVVACVVAFFVVLGAFKEPPPVVVKTGDTRPEGDTPEGAARATTESRMTPGPVAAGSPGGGPLADIKIVVRQYELLAFLAIISGYYLLIEQFYQTFPIYVLRTFGPDAPREYITLINPAAIALLQVFVARFTQRIPPLAAMALGGALGAVSMFLMGAVPSLVGAGLSFFVFALAEMVFSPRYYQYIASFAPPNREGLYMGLSIVPLGIGGLAGGVLSGRLVAKYIPKEGPGSPLAVWGTYAAIGVLCATMISVFGLVVRRRRARASAARV